MSYTTSLVSIPKQLIKDKRLTLAEKMLYIEMAVHLNDGDEVEMSDLALIIERSVKTTKKYFNHLVSAGWVICSDGSFTLNIELKE